MRGIMQSLAGVCGLKISAAVVAKFKFRFLKCVIVSGGKKVARATQI